MSYGDLPHSRLAAEMDAVVDEARAFQETIHGERYWIRPVETTGPRDPFPGHHWRCQIRLGVANTKGQWSTAMCTCSEEKVRL
ncbi:hypothetical protein PBI_DEWDROP_13 [Microbacterium phage Dewdrop]|nr:hypothetical protein PBI_LEAF_13 [Microbacterium phage Leaf]QGZ17382.1 hypothetical protein PBI_DEWDROP_13 [Microbacterium phage Dewdrop]